MEEMRPPQRLIMLGLSTGLVGELSKKKSSNVVALRCDVQRGATRAPARGMEESVRSFDYFRPWVEPW